MRKKLLLVISILVLIFFIFHSNNFRIDASSDTLVAQNDEDFIFFNSYNDIFPSRNFLVLAIKSNKEIDDKYIKVIESLSKELIKLQEIDSIATREFHWAFGWGAPYGYRCLNWNKFHQVNN